MTDGVRYVAYLVSRVPNNHCAMCSYMAPVAWASQEWRSHWCGFQANGTCPSCGRGCARYFLPENDEPLKQYPDDYETKAHDDPKKLAAMPPPTHPRSAWRNDYWAKYKLPAHVQKKLDDAVNGAPPVKPKIDKPTHEPEPDLSGKKTKKMAFKLPKT